MIATKTKAMSSQELANKIISNRIILCKTTDINLKRRLIAENHEMMTELDRREDK